MKPELEAAAEEMQCVTKAACVEVAHMPRPPQHVKDTVGLTMMCFTELPARQFAETRGIDWNKKPTDWSKCKAFLSDPNVLKRLDEFDRDRVPRQRAVMMQERIASLGYEFRSEEIASKSLGAAQLCQWVNGLLHYCHVLY